MSVPHVTAVVVVHGSSTEDVEVCVQSLLDSIDVDLRVVVVDNDSPDGGSACEQWSDHERVVVVRSGRNDGFAAGVNIGLRQRRDGDLVWLLNDDATVEPNAISLCAAMLATAGDVIAVAPRVMLADEADRIDSIGIVVRPNGEAFNAYIGQRWNAQVADGADVLGPCFAATLIRGDAFDDGVVGPIDERYHLYYEDVDWVWRAQRAGYRTLAAIDAVVHHRHASSTRKLGEAARYELVQRNLLVFAARNFEATTALRAWGSRLIVHAKGVVTGPYRRERISSIVRAGASLASIVQSRRRLGDGHIRAEAELFDYATGQSPHFDADAMRSIDN